MIILHPQHGAGFIARLPDPIMDWGLLTKPQMPEIVGELASGLAPCPAFPIGSYHGFLIKRPGTHYAIPVSCSPLLPFIQMAINHRARVSKNHESENCILGIMRVNVANPLLNGFANYTGRGIHFDSMGDPDWHFGQRATVSYMVQNHSPAKFFSHLASPDIARMERLRNDHNMQFELQDEIIKNSYNSRQSRHFGAHQVITFNWAQMHQTGKTRVWTPREWAQLTFTNELRPMEAKVALGGLVQRSIHECLRPDEHSQTRLENRKLALQIQNWRQSLHA